MALSTLLEASPLLLFVGFLVISIPQRRQVGASVGSWLATSAALAVISALPLGSWKLLELSGREPRIDWLAPALIFSAILCSRLVVPLRIHARLGGLAPVAGAVEDRVRSVAERLRVTPPQVRGVQTLGNLQAFAAVVSPMRSTLLVSDGILQRLSGPEVDAIFAHELAHLRNHSLWHIALLFSGSTALGLGLVGLVSDGGGTSQPFLLLGACLGLLLPLYAIYSRPNERWCDLRAARAVGFRVTANALDKIHTTLPLADRGWRGRLAYAVATHPPRVSRLAHLRAHAPPDERAQMPEPDRSELLRSRVTAWVAFLGWLGLVGWGLWLVSEGDQNAATGVLMLPVMVQVGCLLAALWPALRRARRLVPTRARGRWFVWGGLLVIIGTPFGTAPLYSWLGRLAGANSALRAELNWAAGIALLGLASAGLAAVLVGFVLAARHRRLIAKAMALLASQDVEGLAALARRHGRSEPVLRYYAAVCALITGDRQTGIHDLQELAEEPVRVPAALLTLSNVVRAGDPPRSLALAERLSVRLPAEPLGRLSVAFALRANGRGEEAEADARKVERFPGQVGAVALALRARLALDRGEPARAAELLAAASRAAPREPYTLVVQAHLTRLTGTAEETAAAVAEARAAVEQNPLLLLGDELEELEGRLTSAASA